MCTYVHWDLIFEERSKDWKWTISATGAATGGIEGKVIISTYPVSTDNSKLAT